MTYKIQIVILVFIICSCSSTKQTDIKKVHCNENLAFKKIFFENVENVESFMQKQLQFKSIEEIENYNTIERTTSFNNSLKFVV